MHTEHKTLKWCAVLLALIIAIAAIALTALQTVPASAPVTVEIESEQSSDASGETAAYDDAASDTAAIKAMPEEMAEMTTDHHPAMLADGESAAYAEPAADAGKSTGSQAAVTQAADAGKSAGSQATVTQAADAGKSAQFPAPQSPVNVTIKVDGFEMKLMAAPVTVKTALEAYGIPVGENDIVKPAMDQQLTDDAEITVQRIVFEEVVESEMIPFKTKVEGTDELPAKTQKVVQKGKKGEDKVTYKVTYADGKEIARKEIARETVKKPVTKIIHKSTVGTIEGKEYSRKFTVKAYSYTGGGTTASGLPAAVGRIAVDPSVIPLGTRVYVEGYGFATAADTGGNIKGNTIDVYYNSEGQCRQWGCRYITVYILK